MNLIIDGTEYVVDDKVAELIMLISQERDFLEDEVSRTNRDESSVWH